MWAAKGQPAVLTFAPNEGVRISGFLSGTADYLTETESGGVYTVRFSADRPAGHIVEDVELISLTVEDLEEGESGTLEEGHFMDENRGVLRNYGTLIRNCGSVYNYEGGTVACNRGKVFYYGDTVTGGTRGAGIGGGELRGDRKLPVCRGNAGLNGG